MYCFEEFNILQFHWLLLPQLVKLVRQKTTVTVWFSFRINEEEDLNLGTSFSAETNRRDEDADM